MNPVRSAKERITDSRARASSQSSLEADRHWEFRATKSRESFVHEISTVFYDLSATITVFKSWIPRRAFLRFKYRSTLALGGKAVGLWHRTLVRADGTNEGWV